MSTRVNLHKELGELRDSLELHEWDLDCPLSLVVLAEVLRGLADLVDAERQAMGRGSSSQEGGR